MIIADQITKLLVVLELGLHESLPVIRGLLDLTHVRNTGAAFGFLNTADFPGKPVVIAVVAFGALLGVSLVRPAIASGRTGSRGSDWR